MKRRGKQIKYNIKNIILGIVILAIVLVLLFVGYKGITGNVVKQSNSQTIYASKIAITLGENCLSSDSIENFSVGKVNGLEESSVHYVNLSGIRNEDIFNAEFCFAKLNANKFGFEFFISGEEELKCPTNLSDFDTRREGKIAGREIKSFVKSKYYCFNVTRYVQQIISNEGRNVYLGVSGRNLTKSKQTYNYFHGMSNNKLKPYIKIQYKNSPKSPAVPKNTPGCSPNWNCTNWSECVNDKQTRSCVDENNCGVESGKPIVEKICGESISCSTLGIGIYDFVTNTFYLRNELKAGNPDNVFKFGERKGNPKNYYFFGGNTIDNSYYMKNTVLLTGVNNIKIFGSYIPLTGDWDGDGVDTVGLFEWDSGKFYLKNSNSEGAADNVFIFNNKDILRDNKIIKRVLIKNPKVIKDSLSQIQIFPFAGDWDGDGIDTVAIYNAITNKVYYKNSNSDGDADYIIDSDSSFTTSSGDYDGDDKDKVYISSFNSLTDEKKYEYTICYYATVNAKTGKCTEPQNLNTRTYFYSGSVVGDFNNDGKDEEGLYDLETGNFRFDLSQTNFQFAKDIGSDLRVLYKKQGYSWNTGATSGYYTIKNAFKYPVAGKWNGCNKIA